MTTFELRWQTAKTMMTQHDWSQAAASLESLYQQKQIVGLNQDLVTALTHTEQFVTAYSYALEFQSAYLASEARFQQFVAIGLANQAFIPIREFIAEQTNLTLQKSALVEVHDAETLMASTQVNKVQTIAKQFYHLSDVDVQTQQERLMAANQLPLDSYMLGAQFLLVDPFVQPLMRVTILDQLRQLKVSKAVKFQWLDEQQYSIIPSQLLPFTQQSVFQETNVLLEQDLGKSDPILLQGLSEELRLQFLYLYPFSEKVVTDSRIWLKLLRNPEEFAENSKIAKNERQMLKWQRLIERFNQKLADE